MAKNLALPAVASKLGLTVGYCARIERGRSLVSLRTFAALHQILSFDANQLLRALGQRSNAIQRTSRAHKRTIATDCPYELFGQTLQRARVEAQITQRDLARAIDCSEHYYRRIETGRVLPSLLVFARLHHSLGFDANRALAAMGQRPPRAPYHKFGRYLTEVRQDAGLSPDKTANAAGCSIETYRRIEAGEQLPTMHQCVRLHRTLGFRADSALRRIPLGKLGKTS